jgi:hypothetical protein
MTKETEMSEALEVGKKLVALCQAGKAEEAVETLYADDVVSIEGSGTDEMPARMEGIEAVKGKGEWWFANHEVHGMDTLGPFVGHRPDQFAAKFDLDVTPKATGQRMLLSEFGLYTVKDGKVVQEEFLYLMG